MTDLEKRDESDNAPAERPAEPVPTMSEAEIAEEARRGRIAALFALGAVLFTSGSIVAGQPILKKAAKVDDWAQRLILFHDQKTSLIAAPMLFAVACALTLPVLLHLAIAIRSRRPTLPKIVIHLSIAGPLLMALSIPVIGLLYMKAANDFDAGHVQTIAEAKRLGGTTAMNVAQIVLQAGSIAAGFAWVMLGVYGIRTGLLTRVVGSFTVVVGVVTALLTSFSFAINSIPSLIEMLRVFVLGAIAVMLVGAPEKRPLAWREGRAIPWPKLGQPPE